MRVGSPAILNALSVRKKRKLWTPPPSSPPWLATRASARTGNRNLSTDPKRMAVIKVWDAMMRGVRKYCQPEGFVTVHNMPQIVGATNIRDCMPSLINRDNVV